MALQQAMDVAQPHVEHTPLLRTDESEAEAATGTKQPSAKGKAGVAVLLAIAATAALAAALAGGVRASTGAGSVASLKAMDGDDASTSGLSIQFDTDYTLRGDSTPGSDYPWMTSLLEPHRVTTASAVGGSDDSTFTWTFDGGSKTGDSVDVQCKNADKYYTISLEESDSSGNSLGSVSVDAICKYVRREVRALTDDDREAFFTTMEVVYGTSTDEGRTAYGAQYKSAQDFIVVHNTLSGKLDCDHLHGGLGFLPQHAAMTLNFERSLQTVDPSVTVPYWDYTIEGHAMTMANNSIEAWYLSRIWEDDWFGQYSPNGFAITEGRFAYLPVLQDAWKSSSVTNSYGLLRSPWNNNKIPYLTRHSKSYGFYTKSDIVPTCFSHYDQMNMDMFQQFGSSIQYSPHGSLHILAGGTWGADYRYYINDHYDYKLKRAQPIGTVTMARIWRKGWMDFPEFCSTDTPVSECKGVCTDLEDWISTNLTNTMLENMYPGLANAAHFLVDDHDNDISEFFLRMLCNDDSTLNPQIGDFMESASPTDPIFWPTHPTLDRLWHWRKISGFTNEDWTNSTCWGHNEDDTTVWHVDLDETSDTQYTNGELMDLFNPMMVETPYIYDTFEWPHCEAEGYPLQLVEDLVPPTGLTDDAAMAATAVLASAKRMEKSVRGSVRADTRTGLAAQQRDAEVDPDNYAFLGWTPSGPGEVPM